MGLLGRDPWGTGLIGWARQGGQRDRDPPLPQLPPGLSEALCCHLVGSQSLAWPWRCPPTPECHPRGSSASHPRLSPQHYTTDADGLCTRLIKPKVMEGTVAAQDEFSRSECP